MSKQSEKPKIKPAKAWAVLAGDQTRIEFYDLYRYEHNAECSARRRNEQGLGSFYRVIPVEIRPIPAKKKGRAK